MKKTVYVCGVLIILIGLFVYKGSSPKLTDLYDATYTVAGKKVTLKNGISKVAGVTTTYFGNAVSYDFNKDGRMDSAFLITEKGGNGGVAYYLVARVDTVDGPLGSDAVLIGENITPQTTEMGKGPIVVVNYALKQGDESMGKTEWFLLDAKTMQFGVVAFNFEGEADPNRMSLAQKSWIWMSAMYNDGTEIKPRTDKFILTFKAPNTFSATTDCNTTGGQYTTKENMITFENMFSTKMFCNDSQENDFSKALSQVNSFRFTSKGELVFDFAYDSGVMIFK